MHNKSMESSWHVAIEIKVHGRWSDADIRRHQRRDELFVWWSESVFSFIWVEIVLFIL